MDIGSSAIDYQRLVFGFRLALEICGLIRALINLEREGREMTVRDWKVFELVRIGMR